uniref:Tetratricopeptide repeat protein 27 n=1 Tax=Eptatretus burgeri TaxID=7764 RepID=A0A8C4NNS0_EPTBU
MGPVGPVDEWALLRGVLPDSVCTSDTTILLRHVVDGEFLSALRTAEVAEIFSSASICTHFEIDRRLRSCIESYLSNPEHNALFKQKVVFLAGIACLQLFVQCNWTGPAVHLDPGEILPATLLANSRETLSAVVLSALAVDGESVYGLADNPLLLLLAREMLVHCQYQLPLCRTVAWWALRCVNVHQQLLEERSSHFYSVAKSCIDLVTSDEFLQTCDELRHLYVQFSLEAASTWLFYYNYKKAKEYIDLAQKLSALDIKLAGALGKRTHFQQSNVAQLVLNVQRNDGSLPLSGLSPAPTAPDDLPKDILLSDRDLLSHVKLADPGEAHVPDLCAEELAVVLGKCTDLQKSNPSYNLTDEEILAFVTFLLSQPKFWSIQVSALLQRSRLEKGSGRKVERALGQIQTLVNDFEDQRTPLVEKMKVFYCSKVPPKWRMKKELARLFFELGCSASALQLFQSLEMWEDVIVCYASIGQSDKAEELVRRELERHESPTLYCLLGDVVEEPEYYDRAWELSGGHSARAQRSKGLLLLRKKQYAQCVECFDKALSINPMQLVVWYSLGCAHLATEDYEGAARAFQRFVSLEPNNAEAWTNLSTAYIRLQKKDKAFRTLQEAIKCNYETWQIWENFLVVSMDLGEFAEAIYAYHRLFDLRSKYKDVEVLGILVRAVVDGLSDRKGQPVTTLRGKLQELFGRVTSSISDAEIWKLYAQLYGSGFSDDADSNEKALQFLVQSHRCYLQKNAWHNNPEYFRNVAESAIHLARVYIACSKTKSDRKEASHLLSSARLSLKGLMAKAKQEHVDMVTGVVREDLAEVMETMDSLLTESERVRWEVLSRLGTHSGLTAMHTT